MTTTPDAADNAETQAAAQYESVCEMLAAIELDWDRLAELREERDAADTPEELADLEERAGDCEDEEDARQRATSNALSVEVRSGWETDPADLTPAEFRIVLCTGGPAVQIVGDLDAYRTPTRARLMYQDWGTSWTEFGPARPSVLVEYAALFYFGE